MKFNILGSGGATKLPRPCCFCQICKKARKKGIPYAQTGPALYFYDEAILFDTPEEIAGQLNREKIKKVSHVFYTHWHCDHTQGMRIFEHLNASDRGEQGEERNPRQPIRVWIPADALPDFKKYTANIFYFQKRGWIKIQKIFDRWPIKIGAATITPLNIGRGPDRVRYTYLIEKHGKRVVYAICSIYGIKIDQYYQNLDLIILETGWFGETEKIRASLPKNHVWQDHVSFEEKQSSP